jgi:hypothetical protein
VEKTVVISGSYFDCFISLLSILYTLMFAKCKEKMENTNAGLGQAGISLRLFLKGASSENGISYEWSFTQKI